jgi:hypothetical protein
LESVETQEIRHVGVAYNAQEQNEEEQQTAKRHNPLQLNKGNRWNNQQSQEWNLVEESIHAKAEWNRITPRQQVDQRGDASLPEGYLHDR